MKPRLNDEAATCAFYPISKIGRRIQELVGHLHVDPVSSSFEAGLDYRSVVPSGARGVHEQIEIGKGGNIDVGCVELEQLRSP